MLTPPSRYFKNMIYMTLYWEVQHARVHNFFHGDKRDECVCQGWGGSNAYSFSIILLLELSEFYFPPHPLSRFAHVL